MYTAFLSIHNLLRWLVVIAAVIVIVRSFAGWFGRRRWSNADGRAGMIYTIVLDLQVLVGLILYFGLSPITQTALQNFGDAMSQANIRYFAVEHALLMLVAAIVAHVGRSLSRKASDDRSKFRRSAIWFTLSFLLLLAAIPWPFLSTGRPWLRLFGIEL